jgi:hypothetical protein
MLSESRKYRLCLTLSHQLTKQLDADTYHAVIGNCGSLLLAFRVGMEDAKLLEPLITSQACTTMLPPSVPSWFVSKSKRRAAN